MKDDNKPKTYFFAKLPAIHDKREKMQRLIHWEGNEGYGLYIRLLERAVETRGHIPFLGVESTIEEQLSFDLGAKTDKVKAVLNRLVALGLCERLNAGHDGLFIKEAEELTESLSESGVRMRTYREKQRIEASQNDGEASQSDGNEDKNKSNSKSNSKRNSKSDSDAFIESILCQYPKKSGGARARLQIEGRIAEGFSVAQLSNAARVYSIECKNKGTVEELTIEPYNFFRKGGAFLDYINKKTDDVTSPKKKGKAKNTFQAASGRTYDFGALEKQLLGQTVNELSGGVTSGHDQEAPCSGDPEDQHGP